MIGAVVPGLLALTLAAAPQEGLRTIYVTVTDRGGAPVAGLTGADFTVKEDGRIRTIERAEPATDPMQIALLLDDGGPSLGAIRQASGQFVERLQGRAMFSLTTTGGQPLVRVTPTADPRVMYEALQKTFANASPTTQFLDAVVQAAQDFVRRRAVRPVIVAITSEGEELSDVRADAVLQAVQQSRAVFYYIGLGGPVTSGTRPPLASSRPASSTEYESVQRNIVVGSAPKNSGGRSEQVLQAAGILPSMLEFASELVGQYAITYRTDAAQARLEVTTTRDRVRLRAPARVGDR
jgi:VWFA-related protein